MHSCQVRQLICSCIVRLYNEADALPMYARVGSLLAYLQDKDKVVPDVSCLSLRGAGGGRGSTAGCDCIL